jgi:uncharacterized membrane protein
VAVGPVQLMIIGFEDHGFPGRLLSELKLFREQEYIRLLDLLFVRRDARGGLKLIEVNDLSHGEVKRAGAILRGLIGMGTAGHISAFLGARAGVASVAQNDFGLSIEDVHDIAHGISRNTSAALLLIEHHWMLSFKGALAQADGTLLAQGLIRPSALVRMRAELAAVEAAR